MHSYGEISEGKKTGLKAGVCRSVDTLDFTLSDLREMPAPARVLMVRPDYFEVNYVINPHMSGHIGSVNPVQAKKQWEALRTAFRDLGLDVSVIDGRPGLPDMVFSANQSLPYLDEGGRRRTVMSRMHSVHRQGEVPWIEQWYRRNGYEVLYTDPAKGTFEGMGDGIWHHRKELLWGGYGFRTTEGAYDEISRLLGIPVITLRLVDERFYHLDTCFCTLDEKSVMIYPGAFDREGLELIHTMFERVIEAGRKEAEELFAANASCPDGKHVLIQKGSADTNRKLRENGFLVRELDTGEFMKSGGSIFCMKLLLW